MQRFKQIFKHSPSIIGMIHVQALPGTPRYVPGSFEQTVQLAKTEAQTYVNAGVDALLIENMHDIPYANRIVGPEITSAMTVVAQSVKSVAVDVPCGIQILAGCNKEALAVAKVSGLDFIRAEGFIFGHIADEGLMNSDASELLRYRKMIDADGILVFTDVQKKHSSHAITSDLSLEEISKAAEFFLSDGVILTGSSTGVSADPAKLRNVLNSCSLPVLIGSGITMKNFIDFKLANGIIVGSYFKEDGNWKNKLDESKVQAFMEYVKNFRNDLNT